MPIYEYRCPGCGADFEKLQKMSAPTPDCPECGSGQVIKKVSASHFSLKGGGWYKDHYGLKSGKPAAKQASDAGASSKSESASPKPGKTPSKAGSSTPTPSSS